MNKFEHKKLSVLIALLFLTVISISAQDTLPKNIARKRLIYIGTGTTVVYTGGMIAANYAWYAGYPRSKFHLFNDNNEWMQMDKLGHFTSSYFITQYSTRILRWAGLPNKKAVIWGGATSLLFLTSIEVFDGLSTEWGFSTGDMVANVAGTAVAATQELLWKEQRINIKFSYHKSGLAQYRPNLLGKSWTERWLKDYNGQTYWVSVSPAAFYNRPTKFPKWLCFSFGYGANGMIGARTNPAMVDGQPIPHFDRYRQYYFSLDVNLAAIKTKYQGLNTVFRLLNTLKVPFPALEYNRVDQFKFNWLHF
jgi:hypothetical protein